MNENERNILIEKEEERIEETISKIKHRVAVFSGKGGVGKTTVSVNLAFSFQREGFSTGLLDADITGPNVSKMLGIDDELTLSHNTITPYLKYGLKMVSIAGLIEPGKPVIWRGPMRSKMINQFLANVNWGELKYLIADLPPGTGDEILTIVQNMKPDFAIIITTPQEVSLMDAERAVNMAKTLKIQNIGIVENMSGLLCPSCGIMIDLFGTGGGAELAKKTNVNFLGSIPIEPEVCHSGDIGIPILFSKRESAVSESIHSIMTKVSTILNKAALFNSIQKN